MLPAPVVAVNPSPESERMAIFKLDAYVLIIRGKDRVSFVDGLSTNKIEGDCSTVFTTTAAKVIDMADVIDMGDFLALIGHGPYKENLLEHISTRILGQDITLGDASSNNSVFLSTTDIEVSNVVTKRSTWRGWLLVAPNSEKIEATMSNSEFAEDIKKIVEEKFNEGLNEKEIKFFLTERYGEYILFKPYFSIKNLLLWVFPFLVLLVSLGFFAKSLKKTQAN